MFFGKSRVPLWAKRSGPAFSELDVNPIPGASRYGRQIYQLDKSLVFNLELLGFGGIKVAVPAGFLTDFASVPWPMRLILPPRGNYERAAVVHDFLCELPTCPRFLADAVFRVGMEEEGVAGWKVLLMYYAVRVYAVTLLPIQGWLR